MRSSHSFRVSVYGTVQLHYTERLRFNLLHPSAAVTICSGDACQNMSAVLRSRAWWASGSWAPPKLVWARLAFGAITEAKRLRGSFPDPKQTTNRVFVHFSTVGLNANSQLSRLRPCSQPFYEADHSQHAEAKQAELNW